MSYNFGISLVRDPYVLKGEDKRDAVKALTAIIEWCENNNLTHEEQQVYYQALTLLEADIARQAKRLRDIAYTYAAKREELVRKELDRFKLDLKISFMQKYDAGGKKMTPELARELDLITRAEAAACYLVSGMSFALKDCNLCAHKACHRKKSEDDE